MLKRLSFLVLLLAGLLVSFTACSDDGDDPVTPDPNAGTSSLTTLTPTQQADAAVGATQQVNNTISMVDDQMGMMGGIGKTPPTGWVSMGEGWYKDSDHSHGNHLRKIRYSPDVWANDPVDYSQVTKLEFIQSYDTTTTQQQMTMQQGMKYDMLFEWEDAAKTKVKGHNKFDIIAKLMVPQYPQYNYDYSFNWHMTFDGVSTVSDDKSAHYTFTTKWPYIVDMEAQEPEIYWTNFSGEFKFGTDGTGILDANEQYLAGKVSSNGTLFIKYYYNPNGTPKGWYKIAADNFVATTIWNYSK